MLSVDIPAIVRTIEEFSPISQGRNSSSGQALLFFPQEQNLLTITQSYSNTQAISLDKMYEQAFIELIEYCSLPPGWDGYNGKVFNLSAIDSAMQIVSLIYDHFHGVQHRLVEITPGPVSDGSLDIELSDGLKTLIFTVSADGRGLGIYREDEQDSSEVSTILSMARVEEELSWIHGKVLGQVQVS